MTTKTFLRLLNGQKRVEQYIVHVFLTLVKMLLREDIFHYFCRFTYVSISCEINDFVLFFRVTLPQL